MPRSPVSRPLAALVSLAALVHPLRAQAQALLPGCPAPAADSVRPSGPSIALDADSATHYLVGDSVRIGLALNNAPAGGQISFVASGIDRAVVDGSNILRWQPARATAGTNYLTVAARVGGATIACRQVKLLVERGQRAPVIRVSAKQVQAGGVLDFPVSAFDPDGDSLSYTAAELTPNAPAASIDSTGRFRWRAPMWASANGTPYQFKVEASDGTSISAAVFSVIVSGQNVRPECPLTTASVSSSEGSSVLLPMAATDANGDQLRYRPERELPNGRVDSTGYRWDIPWGTVESTALERTVDFQWRAIDTQNVQSDLCTTRVNIRARMEPERLRIEQAAHARFYGNAEVTAADLEGRLEDLRDRINSNDNGARRRHPTAGRRDQHPHLRLLRRLQRPRARHGGAQE
jgi:Bacterial Ig domain